MSYQPTGEMKEEAQRGLDWRSEFGRGGTEVGIARARDIVNGRNLSDDTVTRMYSYFSRHEVDKEAEGFRPGEDGYPSNGRIAWALWGGDAGFAWSKRIVEGRDRSIEHGYTNPQADISLAENDMELTKIEEARGDAAPAKRHIVSITETDDSFLIEFGKSENFEGVNLMPEQVQQVEDAEDDEDEMMEMGYSMDTERLAKDERLFRADVMDADKIDDRRVRMSISSELPVDRSFGVEVLDHDERSIDLDFLNSGRAPLLIDHDPERQIGVIESVELDGSSRRLRAVVRFSRGALASEVYNDVMDGIRSNVSIGYHIKKMSRDENDPKVYRATS
jgi:hypothetical protein